ncbi:MAG: arylamine N-acetyltransferase [Herpetosiphon sp.]|nr:arylamine N-acetyltransferase [Herpetosiphon sp.]
MNIHDYLDRINYHGSLDPNSTTLRALHEAHLLHVPFENLSIHAQQPIVLNDEALYHKIVVKRRGGFCYELNGVFAWLLRSLGFEVAMLAAGVTRNDGGFGPDFDHMALVVMLDQRWLVDVGFGDSFRQPLLFDERNAQIQGQRRYQLQDDGDHLIMLEGKNDEGLKPQYRLAKTTHEFADYVAMCHYHQTSPDSGFTKGRICSIATPHGRISLSETQLIITEQEQRIELPINNAEFDRVLAEYFVIVM